MRMRRLLTWLTVILPAALLAVGLAAKDKKEPDWKIGRVLDANSSQQTYVTGTVTNTSGTATTIGEATATTIGKTTTATGSATTAGNSTSTTAIHRVSIQTNELLIAGDDYLYVIEDSRRKGGGVLTTALANRKHGCRFIVGDDIKYYQEKAILTVIDADGKECKTAILRQEKKQNK